MSDADIHRFQKEAVTGHRPTWKMGISGKFTTKKLNEAIDRFAFLLEETGYYPKEYPKEGKEALAVLELSYPVTLSEIKARYRLLARRYHPDKNQGKKEAEERFKAINEAYQFLKNCGYFTA
jgi:DnaJ-domain-containing protein 1